MQRFVCKVADGEIPGVMWRPLESDGIKPLVLIQHGGSGHKQDANTTALAHQFVASLNCIAVAIDGPIHGERRKANAPGSVIEEFRRTWMEKTYLQSYVDEWSTVIKAVASLGFVDERRIAWCGVSMGTAFGLPLVAAVSGIQGAVFGKWSANKMNSRHLLASAAQVQCPVLFIHHWDDESFDLEGSMDLFAAVAAQDKRMVIYRGPHNSRTQEEVEAYVQHLARTLGLTSTSC